MKRSALLVLPLLAGASAAIAQATLRAQPNASGAVLTFTANGTIDPNHAFFRPFGSGRPCPSCHGEAEGWSVTPDILAQRFANSGGADPVFRVVDGANSPLAPVSTLDQKRIAYSMLLTKG